MEYSKLGFIGFVIALLSIGLYSSLDEITGVESDPIAMANISSNFNKWNSSEISFNGSAVDMNGSLLFNGTFNSTNYIITTNTTSTASNVTLRYYSNHSLIWSEE